MSTIKVNQAIEHAKFEIQRAQLLAEIRTRHLLEIYPKLNSAAHAAAGPFVTYFTTIGDQIEKLDHKTKNPTKNKSNNFLQIIGTRFFSPDGSSITTPS
jgi:hypothetical protein